MGLFIIYISNVNILDFFISIVTRINKYQTKNCDFLMTLIKEKKLNVFGLK